MSRESTLGSWQELVDRHDRAGIPNRWCARPALRDLTSTAQLMDWTAHGDPAGADAVLGELVWLANADGGDDADAVVVLLHLLWKGAMKIANRVWDLCPDAEALVIGELAVQIRRFPIERRTRAYAANLLMDTKGAVFRELEPYRRDRDAGPELIVDPIEHADVLARPARDVDGEADGVLVDLMRWAKREGIVDEEGVAILVELAFAREFAGAAQQTVARWHGWKSVRSVQRRQREALTALRARAGDYLSA